MTALAGRVLAGVVLLAAFAAGVVGLLVVAFDLQIEFAGNGMRPLFSFGAPEAHYAALEADRNDSSAAASVAAEDAASEDAASEDRAAPAASEHDAVWTDFRGPHRAGSTRRRRFAPTGPPRGSSRSGADRSAAGTPPS